MKINLLPMLGEKLACILTTGITPRKTALTLAMGITIGIMPVPWGATPLCALVALVLGLNQAGIQAANYLAYPLQIALFIPFCRAGEQFIPLHLPAITVGGTVTRLLLSFCSASGKALLVWLIAAPFLAVTIYLVLHPLFLRRLSESPD